MKTRPEKDTTSNAFDNVSVKTPAADSPKELDRISVQLSTVGVSGATDTNGQAGMAKFITTMMQQDKPQYERLIELMRFYNIIDVDMRLVSQLKSCFISKEQGLIP